ncbi:carbonic anhydrase [Chelatococcus daeguensis]|uniref:carbonic anhydrase n=2 Tax=Chelatococcus TaxID=28209 RepID=A0AAC9P0E7_9HYPH|nr:MULTISPECIES: carbonic anhydrase [Chelatococcus]APF39529.1 carbonic anhydrase [Chelatococcus daeguensis]KZE29109.1 carbonic anhydrase [Chelatococcus daeguensis]MBM3083814.1 carbonic anhydrase [Chelatococcus daeguensis]
MCNDPRCGHRSHLSRRGLLAAGTAAWLGMQLGPAVAQTGAPPNAIGPDEALKRLVDGNARYAANTAANKDFSAGRAARAESQHPFAAVVSCADSRVAPELAFDQGPGELFVVRVAGNFVNTDGLASLEYGVKFLGIPLIMVLGHTNCGAVDATIKVLKDNAELPGHLPELVNSIKPAVEAAKKAGSDDLLDRAIIENVRHNVAELTKAGPIVSRFVSEGKAKVVGGVYNLATGKVTLV